MRIFERRVPLTEQQTEEVKRTVAQAGREQLGSVLGQREVVEEMPEAVHLQRALDTFMERVIARGGERAFFSVKERQELAGGLAGVIEPFLLALEQQDKRRLESFLKEDSQTVEETLRSLRGDIEVVEEELQTDPEERERESLEATLQDLQYFRDSLLHQVRAGRMRPEDKMSQGEKHAFAQDVMAMGERAGIGVTGKSAGELAKETAEAMVDEYHRMLTAHKILLAMESSYSKEELQAHLKEVVPKGINLDVEGLWQEMSKRRDERRPDAFTKLQIYSRVMKELFKKHVLMAGGFSGGAVLLGYLAPQMAGRLGEFGRTGQLQDAVEGASFGMVSSLAQVELSRQLSLFLHRGMYTEMGIVPKILESVIRSSPELFSEKGSHHRGDRAMLRKYVEDAVESIDAIARQTIEGVGTHLCQAVGLAAASAMRLNNPALFGPVLLATAANTYLARESGRVVSDAHQEVRQASAQFAKRLDEVMEVRATRGGDRSIEREVMDRLKGAQDQLVKTIAKYQQGGGLVMPMVLLLNALLMDRGRPDFFAEYAEGAMYSMQLSQTLTSLAEDVTRIGQVLDPIFRLSDVSREFHEGGDVMPESWEVEFTDVRYKKLSLDSLKISPGELITVVGETGSGKSTLLELLYGFTPDRGLVLIDDVPKSEVILRSYRDGIAVANQFYATETTSFIDNMTSETIPFNPALFRSVVADWGFEPWMREVSKAKPTETVESIGERLTLNRDAVLSGGERKKFALMATDYRLRMAPDSVKMILLDEPTSGADQILKVSIFEAVARWRREYPDKTVVIVNHDPALFEHLPSDSRVLGIEKSGQITQDETLEAAQTHTDTPFHRIFVRKNQEE